MQEHYTCTSASTWVSTWACAQYYGDDTGDAGKASALAVSQTLPGCTLRQIIRTTIGGDKLRLTFSNEYGQTNLCLKDVHIARALVPACSDIDVASNTPVTFGGGCRDVTISPGESAISDDVKITTGALERLAVSMYFKQVPERLSCHVASRANSFAVQGNAVSEAVLDNADINTHGFTLSRIDVSSTQDTQPTATTPGAPQPAAIVVLGDSITDGYGVSDEQYTRWTDVLAQCLAGNRRTRHLSVINMGIGTNKLLEQENPLCARDRFERDVLDIPGVGYFMFLIGVNDLAGLPTHASDMIKAFDEMIGIAVSRGLKVYACTILPYSQPDARRHAINDWLRDKCSKSPANMRLIDFDMLIRNPDNPDFMQDMFNNDGIHPSIAAYKAMGEYAYSNFPA